MNHEKEYKPRIPFENSPAAYKTFTYLNKDREALRSPDAVTYEAIGACLETYVDALHVALLLNEPKFLRALGQPQSHEHVLNPAFIRPSHGTAPKYVKTSIGNYLAAPSFFRKDYIGGPNEPSQQDHRQAAATQFAQETHAQLRKISIDYGKTMRASYPPQSTPVRQEERNLMHARGKALREFDAAMTRYDALFKSFSKEYAARHRFPVKHLTALQKKQIFDAFEQSPAMRDFNRQFRPVIAAVMTALGSGQLKYLRIHYGDASCEIDNTPLNPKFRASTPALMLLALQSVGRHQIDRTYAPRQSFDFFLDVIGVESNITDNLEILNRRIEAAMEAQGNKPNDNLLYSAKARDDLTDMIKAHQRGIQFLHLFHKTAGQLEKIYPEDKKDIAYRDMEYLLNLIGQQPRLDRLETPREASALLYAVERRLRAGADAEKSMDAIGSALLQLAGNMSDYPNFTRVSARVKKRILDVFRELEANDEVSDKTKTSIAPAVALISASLEHILDIAPSAHSPAFRPGNRQR